MVAEPPPEEENVSKAQGSGSTPDRRPGRLTRRGVIGAIGAGALLVAVDVEAEPLGQPRGTPGATPFGSPDAVPATATATPAATPIPPPLQIIHDQQPVYGSEPSRGGTLRLMRPSAARLDFNPASYRQDYQVFASYLDPLLRPDPLTLEPAPWLAESWQVSGDGLAITIQLRPGVRWHDGTPFTARDVRFSLMAYRDDIDTGVGSLFVTMDEVEDVGELEVLVTLFAPDPGWLFNAATLLIFQAAQYEPFWEAKALGERTLTGFDWQQQLPIGTGPWRVRSITTNGVNFDRNDTYWLAPPWFDQLALTWNDDRRERIEAWRADRTDFVWPLRTEDIPLVDDLPGRLFVAEAASVMFAAFSFANPTGLPRFFDDLRLRQALTLAVDRGRYARDVFQGLADTFAAGTIAQPWARDEELRSPEYDPEAALDLLAAAGWADANGDGMLENSNGIPFDLTVIVSEDARRELLLVLRSVKDDWAAIGVALRIQLLPGDEFQARAIRGHDFDLIAYAYDLYPGFTDFDLYGTAWDIRTNRQGWNPGGYANSEADQAIAAFLQATDVASQRRALVQLQRVVNDDLFGLWFGFPADLVLGAIDVDGYQPNKVWQMADTRLLWRTERPREIDLGDVG